MSILKTKFFGQFDINDDCLKHDRKNPFCITDINTKINLKGESKNILISFIGIINYINFGKFNYNTYLDYMDRFVKLLDQYPYLNNIGKNEIIKSYRQKARIMEIYNYYFSSLEKRIYEIVIGDNNGINFKNIDEQLDIKKIVKMADPPNIGIDIDKKGDVFVILQYDLPFVGIISIWLDEHLKFKNIGYDYFRHLKKDNVQYESPLPIIKKIDITPVSAKVLNKQSPIKTMNDAIESLSNWNDKLSTLINEILDDPTDDLISTPKPDDKPDTDESGINLIELATRWKPSLDGGKWPMWIQIGPGFHGVEKDKHEIFHAHFKAVSGETGVFSLENFIPPKNYSEIIVLEGEIPDEYKRYIVAWANEKSKSYPNYDNWYVAIDDWCASCFRLGNITESVPLKEIGTVCEKDDGWGMVIKIHSDDHGVLYDKNNPAFARIKDHNDKYLGQFIITKEKPSSVDYVFDCDNKHIIPAEYKHKIVEWASKPSPKYDEEDGITTNWGAVKASWKNLHPENE